MYTNCEVHSNSLANLEIIWEKQRKCTQIYCALYCAWNQNLKSFANPHHIFTVAIWIFFASFVSKKWIFSVSFLFFFSSIRTQNTSSWTFSSHFEYVFVPLYKYTKCTYFYLAFFAHSIEHSKVVHINIKNHGVFVNMPSCAFDG